MSAEDSPAVAPIAIVGMSCRLSGDVSTLDDFWTLVSRSRDGWRPMPEDRFASNAFYHPNPQKKGCFNQKGGYFMNQDLSEFDAPFFHITEQEAIAMGISFCACVEYSAK
jgi:acyl transferase domain-containing protein